MRTGGLRSLLVVAALALVAGCTQGPGSSSGAGTAAPTAPSAASMRSSAAPTTSPATGPGTPASRSSAPGATAGSARVPAPAKLLVIVEENNNAARALQEMPYLASQAARFARASSYTAISHPSLPNYLAIAGGSTFGVRDDASPQAHPLPGRSVFGQVIASGRVARTYAEGMTQPCQLRDSGRYAVRHNPWTYFSDPAERRACATYDVPAGSPSSGPLHHDVRTGTLPTFGLLVPDVCHDAHDCSLATADSWLRSWLTQIEAGPDFRAGRLAVVVTFDEDDHRAGNRVLTVVVHPRLRGVVAATRLDHYSLSAAVSRLVGASPLRSAAGATSLLAAFRLG